METRLLFKGANFMGTNMNIDNSRIPVIALRGLVLFPNMTLHFDVGRKKSILALNEAMKSGQMVFLTPQKSIMLDDPKADDLYNIGVIAKIRQILKMTNDTVRVAVEGISRARIIAMVNTDPFFEAEIQEIEETPVSDQILSMALLREIQESFDEYAELAEKISPDVVLNVLSADDPGRLADYIASNIMLRFDEKQKILSQINHIKRTEALIEILKTENEVLSMEKEIHDRVRERLDQNQREYYLREQIKVISQELGDSDNPQEEAENYRDTVNKMDLPEEVSEKLYKEIDKLFKMPSGSHEASVIRNYLDMVLELPWNKVSKEQTDLKKAKKILDNDHYGMNKIKERILELIAVRKLAPDIKGQIICLVGPPGVGKTSVAKSIARAMGRKYARISLGGVRDESDIRGHRKTYIGAMPGRIITAVNQAGSKNPLILLDEVDKLGNDFRGDPSSALLEVLDSEQNSAFRDHYIEVPFDLSDVLFVTTANYAQNIPEPLYDRMEIIELSSYTQDEKFNIAKKYLIVKQLKKHGLNKRVCKITDEAINILIDGYTREAGVRTLERQIATICRKSAKMIASNECKSVTINEEMLEKMLGPKKYKRDEIDKENEIGLVNGLAWTSVGGELLPIEVAVMDGTGKLELTGSLGDVMKESAKAAVSYIRANCDKYGISKNFYKNKDIHIHAPEGAVPKDGPSAGISMATAMISALSNIPVKGNVAMTGEITLRGRVLPIGGLKEKSMAAYRNGIKTVIIPEDNLPDLALIADVVKNNVEFIPAKVLDTVLDNALVGGIPKNNNSKIKPESKDAINIQSEKITNAIAQ